MFTKLPKKYNGGKEVSVISGLGETVYLIAPSHSVQNSSENGAKPLM
jgi:hypothetical protein